MLDLTDLTTLIDFYNIFLSIKRPNHKYFLENLIINIFWRKIPKWAQPSYKNPPFLTRRAPWWIQSPHAHHDTMNWHNLRFDIHPTITHCLIEILINLCLQKPLTLRGNGLRGKDDLLVSRFCIYVGVTGIFWPPPSPLIYMAPGRTHNRMLMVRVSHL